jgi:hypothetical protein
MQTEANRLQIWHTIFYPGLIAVSIVSAMKTDVNRAKLLQSEVNRSSYSRDWLRVEDGVEVMGRRW